MANKVLLSTASVAAAPLFANTVAAQRAQGNTVGTVTVTLGVNELAALSPMQNTPAAEAATIAQIPATLAAYRTNETAVLNEIRSLEHDPTNQVHRRDKHARSYQETRAQSDSLRSDWVLAPNANLHVLGYGVIAADMAAPPDRRAATGVQ